MGLAAISVDNGTVTLLGTASVKAGPANLEDCCTAVVAFISAVVRHRETDAAKIIPVIECNASGIRRLPLVRPDHPPSSLPSSARHPPALTTAIILTRPVNAHNPPITRPRPSRPLALTTAATAPRSEITARQYLDAIRSKFGRRVDVPFEKETFRTSITDGIGVYTTRQNKQASVLELRRHFAQNTLRTWGKLETADSSSYNPTHAPIDPEDALETLYEQLAAFRDNPDGTISGPPKHHL
jgi:hypothetical protein